MMAGPTRKAAPSSWWAQCISDFFPTVWKLPQRLSWRILVYLRHVCVLFLSSDLALLWD